MSASQKAQSKETLEVNSGFPKLSRLLNAKAFGPVFKNPDCRVSNRHMLMLSLNSSLPSSRLGIVVAKKNIPTAVHRNRIKRILRESFRIRKTDFGTIDIVVLARKGLGSLENQEVRTQINTLFDELCKKQRKVS